MIAKQPPIPLAPDDPRHGTYAGSVAHWQAGERPSEVCQPCCKAGTRRRKLNKYRLHTTGRPAMVSIIGSQRRIRALQALGWSIDRIADATDGMTAPMLYNIVYARPDHRHRHSGQNVTIRTAERIRAVYDTLSMVVPTTGRVTTVRNLAARNRWAPPLAWETLNIDDPGVEPWGWDVDIDMVIARAARSAQAHNAALDRQRVLEDCITDGVGISEAVRRIGATRSALQKWCGNKGLHHLYRELAGRESGMSGGSQTVDPGTARRETAA